MRARAGELGVSVPRLLVESALSGVETPAERRAWIAGLFELRRLLATVANNVNQLAKVANTSGELPASGRLSRTFGEVDGLVADVAGVDGGAAVIPNITRGGNTRGVLVVSGGGG